MGSGSRYFSSQKTILQKIYILFNFPAIHQNLSITIEHKIFQKLKLTKNVFLKAKVFFFLIVFGDYLDPPQLLTLMLSCPKNPSLRSR